MKRKPLYALIALLILALGGGLAYWLTRPAPPPAPQADPIAVAKFVATPAYKELSEAQKREYARALLHRIPELIAAVQDGKLTEKEQQDGMRNTMSVLARQRVTEYYALPEGKQRTAYLDEVIAEQEGIRKQVHEAREAAAARSGPGKPPPKVVDLSPERLKEMFEGHSPEERARFAQFAMEVNARRVAKGMENMTSVITRLAGGKK